MQSSDPGHFFETDAAQAQRERRSVKAANKYGNPIVLKSKVLAVLADPTSASHVYVAESGGSARRVNIDDGNTKTVFRGPTAPVTSLALSPDNKTLFAGSWDRAIWAFDVATRQTVRKFLGHTDFVKTVACGLLDGQPVLLSGGADKKIIVWDVTTGARLHTLQDATGRGLNGPSMLALQDLAIDPVASTADMLVVLSASSDPCIRRWRIRRDGWELLDETDDDKDTAKNNSNNNNNNNNNAKTTLTHETTVYKVVFPYSDDADDADADELDLWTSSADGTAKCLSRLHSFAKPSAVHVHGDHVRAVAVTDVWVVTAGRDENLQFWDRNEDPDKPFAVIEGHYDEVTGLAVLPGQKRLVSVGLDATVRTWPLDRTALKELVAQQAADKQKTIADVAADEKKDSLLTAEEEAELAELMDDD